MSTRAQSSSRINSASYGCNWSLGRGVGGVRQKSEIGYLVSAKRREQKLLFLEGNAVEGGEKPSRMRKKKTEAKRVRKAVTCVIY